MASASPLQDPSPTDGLGRKAARGAMVTMVGQAVKIVIQIVSVVVLARLLTPYDYGLLAMVMVIVGVADVFRDFGLSSAAIQAKTLSRGQRDNLFWLNTGLGLVLVALICGLSPVLAWFFDQPALTAITCAISVSFLLSGMATQYRADLHRRMLFTRLTVADSLSPIVGLVVAIVLAVNGAGYWALVAQQVGQFGSNFVMVAIAARWLPRRWERGLEMKGFLRFGWNLAGGQLIHYVGSNADAFLIGLRFGPGPLGLYNRGFQLLMTPLGQLRAPMTAVALPVLSRLQDDRVRYAEYLRVGQLAMGYTLVVGLGLVIGAIEPVVDVFLGDQWTGVVWIMRWLALSGIFQTLAFVGYWTYVSRGLVRNLLYFTMVSTSIRIVGVVVGSQFGVNGVAAGYAIAEVISWPLSFRWLAGSANIPVRGLILNGLRVVAVTAIVATASWMASWQLEGADTLIQLIGAVGAGIGGALLTLIIPVVRSDVRAVAQAARQGLTRA